MNRAGELVRHFRRSMIRRITMDTAGRRVRTETEQRLRRGDGAEIVILADGDPLEAPLENAADWDWDTDSVSEPLHCICCGALGPVFRLEDGSRVCAACAHGETAATQTPRVPATRR
jgi:hypothetical protein